MSCLQTVNRVGQEYDSRVHHNPDTTLQTGGNAANRDEEIMTKILKTKVNKDVYPIDMKYCGVQEVSSKSAD